MTDRTEDGFSIADYVTEEDFKELVARKLKAILLQVATEEQSQVAAKALAGGHVSEEDFSKYMAEMHAGQAALFAALDRNVKKLAEHGIIPAPQAAAFCATLPLMSMLIGVGIVKAAGGRSPGEAAPKPDLSDLKREGNVVHFPSKSGKPTVH